MIIHKIKHPPNTSCNNNRAFMQLLIRQYTLRNYQFVTPCENHHFFEVSENNQNQQFFCF